MQENCQSGSEGGAKLFTFVPTPISAQGFNPGLGVLMRCALKGHQNGARRVEFISPQKRSRRSRATFRAHSWMADTQG